MADFRRRILLGRTIDREKSARWAIDSFRATTMEELLSRAVANASSLFESPICVLLLVKEDCLRVEAATGLDLEMITHRQIPIGRSLSGRLAKRGEPRLFSDVSEYAKTIQDNMEPYYSGSMATTPLVFNKQIIGLINVCRPPSSTPLSREDLNRLITYGNQTAFAITSLRLVDKRTAELKEANEQLQKEIIERRQAQESLQFLSSITKQVTDSIIVTGTDFEIIYVNEATEELYGYSAEELIGKSPAILNAEPAAKQVQEDIFATVSSGKVWAGTHRNKKKDGSTFICEFKISPLFDEQGRASAYIAVQRNITERKQSEEALRESEERYRHLVDLSPETIVVHSEGKLVYVNDAGLRLFKIPDLDSVIGRGVLDFVHPDYHELVKQRVKKVYVERKPGKPVEERMIASDGEIIEAEVAVAPIVYKNKPAAQVVIRDITERKRAEESLQRRATQLATLGEVGRRITSLLALDPLINSIVNLVRESFDYDFVSLLLVDPTGEGLALRAAAGYGPEAAKALRLKVGEEGICGWVAGSGKSLLVGDVSKESRYYYVEELTEVRSELAVSIRVKNEVIGVLDAQSTELESFDEEDVFTLQTVADQAAVAIHNALLFEQAQNEISERRQAEEALRESEKQLRESQKMEAVGQLAGGVAHDFNNLLTSIQGYAQFAFRSLRKDDPVREDIQEIQQSAVRAANLTRQLLLFSRRQPMELRVLNENTLIENMMKMIGRLIGEDIALKTKLGKGLWSVEADPGNMEQLIMNLVVNARDAMPEGGEILVKTENVVVDEEYCRAHTDARPGDFVCLSVKDAGMGMEKETLEHIFEPFFTTKHPGTGTGLGLSVVYGIVKQHDGWIEVESAVGQGTTFRTYLPVISTKAAGEEMAVVSLESLRGREERILLVEDDESVRKFASRGLSQYGYVIFAAGNAQEAVDIFQREGGRFDLIFSDVVLPDERGPQVVERLLELEPGIAVIFASGYSDKRSGWQAIRDSGYPYIQKPYSLSRLLEVVNDTLKREGKAASE